MREGAKSFCKTDKILLRDKTEISWKESAPDGRFDKSERERPDSWLTFWAEMTPGKCQKSVEYPVSDPDGDTACETLLFNNYKKCKPFSHLFPQPLPYFSMSVSLRCKSIVPGITNKCDLPGINGGTGGSITVGCVTYGFRPYQGPVRQDDLP